MSTLYHVGVSGGKDSTALLLWAVHRSGLPLADIRVTFCDTQNEDVLTYAHLRRLQEDVVGPAGIPGGIEWLTPELGFFDLAFKKGLFPARKSQFCTQYLKLEPTRLWLRKQWDAGHTVVMLNGKRTGESSQRKKKMKDKPVRGFSDFWGCEEWAAIHDWTIEQVYAIHDEHGIPLNPLYGYGAKRVGCFPCVNCGKDEIRIVSGIRPEKIDQIRAEEKRHEDAGRISTFFHSKTTTAPFRTKTVVCKDGTKIKTAPIDEVVMWAKTVRGGRQFRLELDEPKACFKGQLLCE